MFFRIAGVVNVGEQGISLSFAFLSAKPCGASAILFNTLFQGVIEGASCLDELGPAVYNVGSLRRGSEPFEAAAHLVQF